ncbi:MAG TPA: histidinol dehydrogenase [Caulobacteraceae bacterium]|jgi:histidinol dehydrogenase
MVRLDAADPGFEADFAAFLARPRGATEAADAAVAEVIERVRADGVAAVLDFSRRFDGVELTEAELRVSPAEIEAGAAECAQEVRQALAVAASRIRTWHERQKPEDFEFVDAAGVTLGWRWTPLDAVGIYVPGGRAAYPSTVLMNAVPAAVAGVSRIAMVSPPGHLAPAVLAAAREAGVSEIWRVGGAQAVAALAYGAGPIRPVDKIVGPGNAYVAAAKRRVYGKVGIDSLAGPSEIVVVADAGTDPAWIAADLLSQAEHDPDAQAILITADAAFAEAVETEVERQLQTLPTCEVAAASWRDHGAIILAPLERAPALVDAIAPEHVEFALADPEPLASRVRHAGAIFLGSHAPEAVGDYVAGPNHVLPTSGTARFSSGLATADFMKRTSLTRLDAAAFARIAGAAETLAKAEGLPAHARSLAIRRKDG